MGLWTILTFEWTKQKQRRQQRPSINTRNNHVSHFFAVKLPIFPIPFTKKDVTNREWEKIECVYIWQKKPFRFGSLLWSASVIVSLGSIKEKNREVYDVEVWQELVQTIIVFNVSLATRDYKTDQRDGDGEFFFFFLKNIKFYS